MEIRHSAPEDLPRMEALYVQARQFMKDTGNPNQWGPTHWPPTDLLRADIAAGRSYVCTHRGRVVGTFCFLQGEDIEPTYRVIREGAWHYPGPYGVVHRLAGDGSVKGIGAFCLDWALRQCGHLRVDTHGDNHVMQRLLQKSGFAYCGIIHVLEDHYPRLAYDKRLPPSAADSTCHTRS